MTTWYLDTSAALKLLVEEAESPALARELDTLEPDLVSCWLLDTELRRASQRTPDVTQSAVSQLLDGVSLYEVPASLFREAGLLPGPALRSVDAIHLAAAIRIGVDAVVTYDTRLTEAARALGMQVVAPS